MVEWIVHWHKKCSWSFKNNRNKTCFNPFFGSQGGRDCMLKKAIAIAVSLLLLLVTVSANSGSSQIVVDIPGQLEAGNNVVFNFDGQYGFVASYRDQDGEAGKEVYSFDTRSGAI